MSTVECPCPQPTSATVPPRRSRSVTPSSAGSQEATRLLTYFWRKKRPTAQNRHPAWSPQPTPPPVRNASATRSVLSPIAAARSKAPRRSTGLSS